jgi:hypothetical protein
MTVPISVGQELAFPSHLAYVWLSVTLLIPIFRMVFSLMPLDMHILFGFWLWLSTATKSVDERCHLGICTVWPLGTKSQKMSFINTAVKISKKTMFFDPTKSIDVHNWTELWVKDFLFQVRWNACYAIGNTMRNSALFLANSAWQVRCMHNSLRNVLFQ